MCESIVLWLKSTAISHAMVDQPWLWPLCETLHFVGLALLIGAAGVFDLRLLGFMRRLPVAAAMRSMPTTRVLATHSILMRWRLCRALGSGSRAARPAATP